MLPATRIFPAAITMAVLLLGRHGHASPAGSNELPEADRDRAEAERVQKGIDDYLPSLRIAHSKALKEFSENPSAQHLAELAKREADLGYWVRAADHMDRVLGSGEKWVDLNRDVLERRRQDIREHVARIFLHGPDGAVVSIDGVVRGMLPLPAELNVLVGDALVTYDVEGRARKTERLTVKAGSVPQFVGSPDFGAAATAPLASAPAQSSVIGANAARPSSGPSPGRNTIGKALLALSVPAYVVGGYFLGKHGQPSCDPPQTGGWVCNTGNYDTRAYGLALIGAGLAADAIGGFLILSVPSTEMRVSFGPSSVVAAGRF
jgi:hypothetical protein